MAEKDEREAQRDQLEKDKKNIMDAMSSQSLEWANKRNANEKEIESLMRELSELKMRQETENYRQQNPRKPTAKLYLGDDQPSGLHRMTASNHTLNDSHDFNNNRTMKKKRVAREEVEHLGQQLENRLVAKGVSFDHVQNVAIFQPSSWRRSKWGRQ